MDAGLAGLLGGVIGAAVGGLFTTTAAYLTGRKAEQQTRLQLEAQRERQREQLQSEHVRERREPRAQAYTSFLTFVDDAMKILQVVPVDPNDQVIRRAFDQIDVKMPELRALETRVRLEGPDAVIPIVDKITGGIIMAWTSLDAIPPDIGEVAHQVEGELPEAIDHFLHQARRALEGR
ncbi:hypothetical protein [Streptomyces sp. bgisy034]|uniref:hypothetical protein n=1 Tax=Streptomyces sp. bgisy034 TaxID=3413774 RepID=UPI003EBC211C